MKQGMKIALAAVGSVFLIAAFGGGVLYAQARTLDVFPKGFTIGSVDVSGMTQLEALTAVSARTKIIEQRGISVFIPGQGIHTIALGEEDTSPDTLFVVSPEESVHDAALKAADLGLITKMRSVVGLPTEAHVPFAVSGTGANTQVLSAAIAGWNLPLHAPQNARFIFDTNTHTVRIEPDVAGQRIPVTDLSTSIFSALQEGKTEVEAAAVETDPPVTTATAETLLAAYATMKETVTQGIVLQIAGSKIQLSPQMIVSFIQPVAQGSETSLGIDPAILQSSLQSILGPFEQQGRDAQFAWSGNRATTFVPEQMGRAIDWDALATQLFAAAQTASSTIEVPVKEAAPAVTLAKLNDLGIQQEIGFGTSDYSGSTPARIVNIKTGMAKIEGALIAPGDTFSLVQNLLPITAAGGYVQELVIKDNKTQPDYGGGLCQIGTTTFRAAMGAGLPIVERQNHSYQVHYYFENGVSGTDATIYDPKPDFRFTNDTGHWIMLHTEMLPKNILRFSVWGTLDGRTTSRTIPKTLATQPPPPKKIVETTDLPVGKKKCTELAHEGATMQFTYSVTYPDGTLKKVDFTSFYKPWGEVCLLGVAPTSTPDGLPLPPIALSPDAAGVNGN